LGSIGGANFGKENPTWVRGVVLQIAHRRAYIGQLDWGIKVQAEPKRRRRPTRPGKDKRTSYRRRPEKDWVRIAVPPIIDPATFEKAQQALTSNRKAQGGRPSQTYLLTACSAVDAAARRSAAATRMDIRITSAAAPIW
jgi:hypothetical protein